MDAPWLVGFSTTVEVGGRGMPTHPPAAGGEPPTSSFAFSVEKKNGPFHHQDGTLAIDGLIFHCLEGKKKTQPSRVTAANCGPHPACMCHLTATGRLKSNSMGNYRL